MTELIEDKIQIFKRFDRLNGIGEGDVRPFVNSIIVKLKAKELANIKKKKKDDYIEQKFRITKMTTFDDLKKEACQFWGMDPLKLSLYDENFHDLMSLNHDPSHIAHTVEKYFEITRLKSIPNLYL